MKRITDKEFKYKPSSAHATSDYLHRKFKRLIREMQKEAEAKTDEKPVSIFRRRQS